LFGTIFSTKPKSAGQFNRGAVTCSMLQGNPHCFQKTPGGGISPGRCCQGAPVLSETSPWDCSTIFNSL